MLGMVEDEANILFGQNQAKNGIGPDTRDRFLRTLVRNTYSYHMNEIFATVQNEYTDWTFQGPLEMEPPIRPRHLQMSASRALTDKLYVAPILTTANWCNQSAFQTFLYVYSYCDSSSQRVIII
jgi:neuroligin